MQTLTSGYWRKIACIFFGSAIFALGFDLFLAPNQIHAGGVSGIATLLAALTGFHSIGLITLILNIPLLLISAKKLGRWFFVGSLMGVALSSGFLELCSLLPAPTTEPLVGALFGGVITGAGLGVVLLAGASTGGIDIASRLLHLRYQNFPLSKLMLVIDLVIVALTGLVFQDINKALYSGITLYVCSETLNAVICSFDYSKVALIVSKEYAAIAAKIGTDLNRGVTLLNGEGYYAHKETCVLLCAVKRSQTAELKALVAQMDSDAFLILMEAHQVLGSGFKRYSKDSLT